MKAHEFQRIVKKLNLVTRNTGDRYAWFEYEGRVITRTKCSHGKGDVPAPHMIRQQLKLNEQQLSSLIACNFKYDDYVTLLRSKGLL